ncbi:MAG: hypothetical protein QY317_16680 [Candidatus Jettenia caeni]|nr:MAG: hypothetical protein QY317_16680 [Candidatus Jettenia caeni]
MKIKSFGRYIVVILLSAMENQLFVVHAYWLQMYSTRLPMAWIGKQSLKNGVVN